MLSNKRSGFTLIELLVVVLIIGILAAVAVPQYQKAVTKANITQELAVFDVYKKAINVWLLANGWPSQRIQFTGDDACSTPAQFSSLDIEFSTEKRKCSDKQGKVYVQAFATSAAAAVNTGFADENGNYLGGDKNCRSQFQLMKGAEEWSLAGIYHKSGIATADQCPDYQRIMCQYWITQGTGLGRSSSITQCARFGITLTLSE